MIHASPLELSLGLVPGDIYMINSFPRTKIQINIYPFSKVTVKKKLIFTINTCFLLKRKIEGGNPSSDSCFLGENSLEEMKDTSALTDKFVSI